MATTGLLTPDVFDYFSSKGRFCFILDGFDEVPEELRDDLQAQIAGMAAAFPDCTFVVSSRPDKRFSGWQGFSVFQSAPFDLNRVQQLIEKVPFDPSIKKIFKKRLDKNFYNEHKSFLSNPLLAIMMLMTFKENMDIPSSMNIFYDQAFNTLFTWHDATKAFSRQKSLDIDEFRKSFSVFCLTTYYDEKYEFTESEIFSYLGKVRKVLGLTLNEQRLLKDFVEAVNLMRQDGLKYVFIHRSFQEYFAALALVGILQDKIQAFLQNIEKRPQDNLLRMAYEMNPGLITRAYVTPNYDLYIKSVPKKGDSFSLLSRFGLTYHIVCLHGMSKEGSFMTLQSRHDVFNFMAVALKIKDNVIGGVEHPGFCPDVNIIHMSVMEVLEPIARRIGKNIECTISFTPDDLLVEIEVEGNKDAALEERVRKGVLAKHDRIRAAASGVSANIRRQVEAVRKWSEERIAESERRSASIDLILGVT